MRVAVVAHRYPLYSETFVLEHIRSLLQYGHEVTIYSRGREPCAITGDMPPIEAAHEDSVIIPSWKNGANLAALRCLSNNIFRHPSMLLLPLELMKSGGGRFELFDLSSTSLLRRTFDLVHVHHASNSLGLMRLRRDGLLRCPIVVTVHGSDINVTANRDPSRFRPLLPYSDVITVGSDFMRRKLEALSPQGLKVRVLPMGVDVDRIQYRPASPRDMQGRKLRAISVGRLVEVKGIEYAIRAVYLLQRHMGSISLDIIGGGPEEINLKRLIRDSGLESNVHLHGSLPHEEVLSMIHDSDIYIYSGVQGADGAEEGQGLAILEAQAIGLPIVATRVGAVTDIVREGVSGFLVPQRDPTALAEAFLKLIETPERWTAMGRAGRDHVERYYSLSTYRYNLQELYQSLVSS